MQCLQTRWHSLHLKLQEVFIEKKNLDEIQKQRLTNMDVQHIDIFLTKGCLTLHHVKLDVIILLGQGFSPQFLCSWTAPSHSAPPYLGPSHDLFLYCNPPPHVTEQSPQTDQFIHTPSSARKAKHHRENPKYRTCVSFGGNNILAPSVLALLHQFLSHGFTYNCKADSLFIVYQSSSNTKVEYASILCPSWREERSVINRGFRRCHTCCWAVCLGRDSNI